MNTGAFGEGFPYSNFHDLNMDWIIKIAKDFLDQYSNIQQTIQDGLDGLDTKYEELEGLLDTWYETHSSDIADQLADALEDLNDWYTLHENYLDAKLTQNETAFDTHAEQKATEVIASIPDDYTEVATLVHYNSNPFVDTVTDEYYLGIVKRISLYGIDINKQYTLGIFRRSSTSCDIAIFEWVNGNFGSLVCRYRDTESYDGHTILKLKEQNNSGVSAIIVVDWTTMSSVDRLSMDYTRGGINVSAYNSEFTLAESIVRTQSKTLLTFPIQGTMINATNGNASTNNVFDATDFIPVSGTELIMQEPFYDLAGLAFYDNSKTYISGVQSSAANSSGINANWYTISIPSNAKYLRTCKYTGVSYNGMIGNVDTESVKYNLAVPDTIYITPDVPIRLFYYQVIGTLLEGCYFSVTKTGNVAISPADEFVQVLDDSTGSSTITITIKDKTNNVIGTRTLNIVCVNTMPTQKAIFIGDSLTSLGIYLAELKYLMGSNLTLYGTLEATAKAIDNNDYTVKHEGRGGWSATTYCTQSANNPFYNNGFSFTKYITDNPTFSDVTDVYIMLGMNGTNTTHLKQMIDSVKSYNSSINVHVILQPKMANDPFMYGINYHANFVDKQNSFNNYNMTIINTINADIIPANINVDPYYNYEHGSVNISYRQPLPRPVITDIIHPNKYGFYNIADVIFAHLNNN